MFYEIVVAPGYTPEGLEVLKGKSKALRILGAKPRAPSGRSLRQVAGGWLMQVCMGHVSGLRIQASRKPDWTKVSGFGPHAGLYGPCVA